MPAWPSFVPLVQEMLALVVSGQAREQQRPRRAAAGRHAVDAAATQLPVAITEPDGHHDDLQVSSDAGGGRWSFADTWQSGVYLVADRHPAEREELFVVNVDTSESDLARRRAGRSAAAVHHPFRDAGRRRVDGAGRPAQPLEQKLPLRWPWACC